MQTIIIATDLSPAANNATLYAVKAAQITKEKIILFHLYKVPPHVANSLVGTKAIDEMAERMKSKMQFLAESLISEFGVQIEVVVRLGEMMEVTQQMMDEYQSTMLVVGMPKKTFEQDLMGNTTTAAIYRFKFPILAVPESASFIGIREILYAFDLAKGVNALILRRVKEYAMLFNAKVKVIYVGDAEKSIKEEQTLKRELEGIEYEYKNVQSDSVIKAIKEEAVAISADVLIMTPHKYSFWASILHQSRTKTMLSHGKIPLLSIGY